MKSSKQFDLAVAELVSFLEEGDTIACILPRPDQKKLEGLLKNVKDKRWYLPLQRFAHDEEFEKAFGFPKDSMRAKLWCEILDLPDYNEAFEQGLIVYPLKNLAIIEISHPALNIFELVNMDSIETILTRWPGLPVDAKVLCRFDSARIDDRVPSYQMVIQSKAFGISPEGVMPPRIELLCDKRLMKEAGKTREVEQLFPRGVHLHGSEVGWWEGSHSLQDGDYLQWRMSKDNDQ